MVSKIKRIVYRLRHPLFWPKEIIIAVVATQVGLIFIVILWIINITKVPEKPYVKKTLHARRELIKNLKLANIESYVWRPVLNCENILADDHYKKHTSDKSEKKHCIPMSIQFSNMKHSTKKQYVKNHQTNVVTYEEKVEKPCLICHTNRAKSSMKWIYHISSQTSRHLASQGDQEIIKHSIVIAAGLVCIFWFIYSALRFIMHNLGKLDVLALSFLNEIDIFPKKFLDKMGLKKSNFLYAELGDHVLRGYISRSIFLKWLESLIENKILKEPSNIFLQIKGSIMRANNHNDFEGMRISQIIAKRAETGRIIFEQAILPNQELNHRNTKKIVWQVRRNNYIEPQKYQFIDLKFESITDLVDTRSLIKKNAKHEKT